MLLNWTPAVALAVGALVYFTHRHAMYVAVPILLLWAISKPVSFWLNRPPHPLHKQYHAGRPALPATRRAVHLALLRYLQ